MNNGEQGRGRIAEYRENAAQMTTAAEKAIDPLIASAFLALAAQWERLAQEVGRSTVVLPRKDGIGPNWSKPGRAPGPAASK